MTDIRTLAIEPDPDFYRLETALRRQGEPDRVPFFELFSNIQDDVLKRLGKYDARLDRDDLPEADLADIRLQQHIEYQLSLGYDYINVGTRTVHFPQKERPHTETDQGERSYQTAEMATITGREDFDNYPWPDPAAADYTPWRRAAELIPDGMKVITLGPGGVLENTMWLLGYQGISYLLMDDEPLVRDVFDAVGSRLVDYFGRVAALDVVGAVNLGDDMGFKTQTMLSPAMMREYVFPWHRKIVEAIHAHGKPAIIHTCGNLEAVMDDLIDCGWEAKHSFEDVIEPVWEVKKKYGDRIALLGGFDMDKISRFSDEKIREHVRFLIGECAPGGGWALGTGNSVANYVPTDSLLTMVEEGFLRGRS